ncbi:guanine nucleotide exchange protein for ADP-robosylation factor, partial [Podochytrium sp. JEL0797]
MSEIETPPRTSTPGSAAAASPHVFLRLGLSQLLAHRDAAKVKQLVAAVALAQETLAGLEAGGATETALAILFAPLRLAACGGQPGVAAVAVDTLGKLFGQRYWARFASVSSSGEGEVASGQVPSGNGDVSSGQEEVSSGNGQDADLDSVVSATDGGILADAVRAICAAEASADERLQLQIVKALSSAVLAGSASSIIPNSPSTHSSFFFDKQQPQTTNHTIHGPTLLRAIRSTFNIFLLAKSPSTQIVAQAALTQMIQAVFGRVPRGLAPLGFVPGNDDLDVSVQEDDSVASSAELQEFDQNIKDIFLVFRALCKLSMKPIPANEGSTDLKSNAMRSKLLSLHLIHTILCSHMHILFLNTPMLFPSDFIAALVDSTSTTSSSDLAPIPSVSSPSRTTPPDDSIPPPTPTTAPALAAAVTVYTPTLFIHAIKPYLCLSITRNAVSVVPQVFDVSMEIFGLVLMELRVFLKSERSEQKQLKAPSTNMRIAYAVLRTEILLPILESKSTQLITFHQRTSLLKILTSLLSPAGGRGGRLLVEIYLNYDCDPESTTSRENIWDRFVMLLSRLVTQQHHASGVTSSPALGGGGGVSTIGSTKSAVIRPMTTQALTSLTKEQLKELYSTSGDFGELKKRGVEVLVRGVLAPL